MVVVSAHLAVAMGLEKSSLSVPELRDQFHQKGMILYRNPTADHFENGEWFSGGSCKRAKPAEETSNIMI
ncbi:hypothetical protein ACET3Z_006917 [Daucus carota]